MDRMSNIPAKIVRLHRENKLKYEVNNGIYKYTLFNGEGIICDPDRESREELEIKLIKFLAKID